MKKYSIFILLMMTIFFGYSQTLPCNDFNTGVGNWVATSSNMQVDNSAPIDGTNYLDVNDASGGSWVSNSVDFNNLGHDYPYTCLCFDYRMFNPGTGGTNPHTPRLVILSGTDQITFIANNPITVGTGWVTLCAPIEPSLNNILPGNDDGQWVVPGTVQPQDISTYFNDVLDNATEIRFNIDNGTSNQDEHFAYDNVCITNCGEELNHTPIGCLSESFQLFAWVDGAVSYSWTFPNGLTTTVQNPVVSLPLGAGREAFEGTYTCTVTYANGTTKTFELYVNVPSDCCEGEITVERNGCFNFTFGFESVDINLEGIIWTIDGVYETNQQTFSKTFAPGTYEICAHYFGETVTGEICCDEECVTITIPETEFIDTTISKCEGDNYWFNPCEHYSDFAYYLLSSINPHPGYNSDSRDRIDPSNPKGCIAHNLIPGNYTFAMFDENDCLIRVLNITITETPMTEHVCEETITVNCGDDVDLSQYVCDGCEVNPEWGWDPWFEVVEGPDIELSGSIVTNITQSKTFRRELVDHANCEKCVQIIHINVVRSLVMINVVLTQPNCTQFYSLVDLNNLAQQHNPTWCTGSYTAMNVVQYDLTGTTPTGNNFQVTGGTSYPFQAGFMYVIQPDDPNSCCEIRIKIICDEGESMPMNENELNHIINNSSPAYRLVPNPTSSVFRIVSENGNHVHETVTIVSSTGQVVAQLRDVSGEELIDASDFAKGQYYIVVKKGEDQQAMKLLLQ